MNKPPHKIKFRKRHFEVSYHFKENGQYDLEIVTKGSLCGDDYVALRKYLEDEGYADAARSWNGSDSTLANEL